jgi:hypothetical protein
MTTGAWLMLLATWTVVILFTARFFWKVLTLPSPAEDEPPPTPR